eukprot:CAMPEP_0182481662 /NCGR_PEP_ID=MMETSP1319-20130603/37717_1 /TAXON_ID=172717 /ORGANISM="Bolidomonas pacifica, Strain RCC208" /LENGTH=176 /DNA_ID=CAMNT_0024683293 /DNA_START=437 /DNA_END=964 /DNA_ORIENTATION=-
MNVTPPYTPPYTPPTPPSSTTPPPPPAAAPPPPHPAPPPHPPHHPAHHPAHHLRPLVVGYSFNPKKLKTMSHIMFLASLPSSSSPCPSLGSSREEGDSQGDDEQSWEAWSESDDIGSESDAEPTCTPPYPPLTLPAPSVGLRPLTFVAIDPSRPIPPQVPDGRRLDCVIHKLTEDI